MGDSDFHKQPKFKAHQFVMKTYDITESFPKSELFGTASQIRRASVSIILNYIEGYARFKPKVKLNFWEISYGSAKECQYLVYLAFQRNWIVEDVYNNLFKLLDEILAMLWSIISGIKKTI